MKTYEFPPEYLFPGEAGFEETMMFGWEILMGRKSSLSCVFGVDGLPRSANEQELNEYLEGGEYDQRQSLILPDYLQSDYS